MITTNPSSSPEWWTDRWDRVKHSSPSILPLTWMSWKPQEKNRASGDMGQRAGTLGKHSNVPRKWFTVTSVWKQTSVCWWKSKVWSLRMMECHSVFNRREILMLLCGWTLRALRCMKREETLCDSTGMTGLQQHASQRQKTERSESVSSACRTSAHQMRKLWGSIPQLCEQTEHLSTGCFGMVLWWQSLCYVIFLPQ